MIFSATTETNLIFCCGPRAIYERDEDVWDRYYIAARMLGLLRPGRDLIILPGLDRASTAARPYLQALRAFVTFMQPILGLAEEQIIWTSGQHYVLDDDIGEAVLVELVSHLGARPEDWCLVPYARTPEFERWAQDPRLAGVRIFGDQPDEFSQAGKAILHAPINPQRRYPRLPASIMTPPGYSCFTHQELETAFQTLRWQLGHEVPLVVKAVHGAAGQDITPVHSLADLRQIKFTPEGMVIEQWLDLACHEDGSPQSISVQFTGGQMTGPPAVQLIRDNGWAGGIIPANNTAATRQCLSMAQQFATYRPSTGFFGLDFLIDQSGQAYLVDPNLRMTGMHPGQIFTAIHGQGQHVQVWTTTPNQPIAQLWKTLGDHRFQPQGDRPHGLIPLCWLYSPRLRQGYGMMMALGEDRGHTQQLREMAATIACLV